VLPSSGARLPAFTSNYFKSQLNQNRPAAGSGEHTHACEQHGHIEGRQLERGASRQIARVEIANCAFDAGKLNAAALNSSAWTMRIRACPTLES
jgi:hypothetical protein